MHDAIRRIGGCVAPVRVKGQSDRVDTTTGEIVPGLSTEGLPDDSALVACRNRRASVCPPCSRVYQGDAYQLVRAGLAGGKNVPETVTGNPAWFVTLTAPSFGPVHTQRRDRSGHAILCRPRAGGESCPHGVALSCTRRHSGDDALLGQPICADCFDYPGAVWWNNTASELWRRTRIRIYRELAHLLTAARGHKVSEAQVKREVSVQYAKVSEYQKRGLIHFHLVVRLDGAKTSGERYGFDRPPVDVDGALLAEAIRRAHRQVQAPYPLDKVPAELQPAVPAARWGEEIDLSFILPDDAGSVPDKNAPPPTEHTTAATKTEVRRARRRTCTRPRANRTGRIQRRPGRKLPRMWAMARGVVAGYLAKYTTKDTEALGHLNRRLVADDLPALVVTPHVRRLVETCRALGEHTPERRFQQWAHQLGYRGHCLTKSRYYSTTFKALRAARADHRARQADPQTEETAADVVVPLVRQWALVGVGYRTAGDRLLADSIRADLARQREAAAEARREEQRQLAAVAA